MNFPSFIPAATLALTLVLGGCGPDGPQSEHTFYRLPSAAELDARGDQIAHPATIELKARLTQQELIQKLHVTVQDAGTDAPAVDMGFFPGREDGYAVFRDGTAVYITAGGGIVPLDKLAPRIDSVDVIGRRVIGLHPRGTLSSWNTGNLTQQLVLRTQQSTFEQRHTLDAVPVSNTHLAVAVEDRVLELWSLISGNRLRATKFPTIIPRVIARGNGDGHVIFGTDQGGVRIWHGGNDAPLLYTHSGPVLDVQIVPSLGLIVSASKDGTVKIYHRQSGLVVKTLTFPRAIYDISVSPDNRFLIAAPAIGSPHMIDLQGFTEYGFAGAPVGILSSLEFAGSQFAASISDGNDLRVWHLDQRFIADPIRPISRAEITDFSTVSWHRMMAVATSANDVEYHSFLNRIGPSVAVHSLTEILGVEVSDSGQWMLISLSGGRIARLRVDPTETQTVNIQ